MASRSAGGTPATRALERAGIGFTPLPYTRDASATSYGLEAAEALGLDPRQVFKTLLADVDGSLVVALVPVSGQLDLKSLAAAAGGKRAAMADPATAERATGYVLGGISPFGQRRQHPTFVDASALEHETIYVSGGKRGLDLAVAPQDLIDLLTGSTAPIRRA